MAEPDVLLLSNYMLEHGNHALVEFVCHLKHQDGSNVMPTTLKNYQLELQRAFKTELGYDINKIFGKVFSDLSVGVFNEINHKNTCYKDPANSSWSQHSRKERYPETPRI